LSVKFKNKIWDHIHINKNTSVHNLKMVIRTLRDTISKFENWMCNLKVYLDDTRNQIRESTVHFTALEIACCEPLGRKYMLPNHIPPKRPTQSYQNSYLVTRAASMPREVKVQPAASLHASFCRPLGLWNVAYAHPSPVLCCFGPKVPCLCKIFSRVTYSFGPKVPCLCPNILQSPVKLDPQEYVFFAFLSSVRPISFPSLEHVPRLHRSRSPRPSHHLVWLPARSSKTIYRIPNLYKQFWTKLWEKIMKKKLWIDRFRKHLD